MGIREILKKTWTQWILPILLDSCIRSKEMYYCHRFDHIWLNKSTPNLIRPRCHPPWWDEKQSILARNRNVKREESRIQSRLGRNPWYIHRLKAWRGSPWPCSHRGRRGARRRCAAIWDRGDRPRREEIRRHPRRNHGEWPEARRGRGVWLVRLDFQSSSSGG